jgi:hypothetical protein
MYLKKVSDCEKCINDFLVPMNGVYSFSDDNTLTGQSYLEKKDHQFKLTLKWNQIYHKYFGKFFPLDFFYNTKVFFCKEACLNEIRPFYDITIKCSSLSCGKESTYYRLVIPNMKIKNFFSCFPVFSFSSENYSTNSNLTKLYINGYETHIFIDKINSNDALFIDYLGPIDKESFYINCTRILCAMGLISGVFQKDECFIISSRTPDFGDITFVEYRYIGNTISSNCLFFQQIRRNYPIRKMSFLIESRFLHLLS